MDICKIMDIINESAETTQPAEVETDAKNVFEGFSRWGKTADDDTSED